MTIISHEENEFCLLDPGFDKEWYESPEILMNSLQTENSGFFCFRRK